MGIDIFMVQVRQVFGEFDIAVLFLEFKLVELVG